MSKLSKDDKKEIRRIADMISIRNNVDHYKRLLVAAKAGGLPAVDQYVKSIIKIFPNETNRLSTAK